MRILIKNIRSLVQVESKPRAMVCGEEMSKLKTLENAWLLIEEGRIAGFGNMKDLPAKQSAWKKSSGQEKNSGPDKYRELDASGKMVFPSFCDSHTHLVYAGSREIEYIDKIRGLSYEEIAKRGGGILNSARRLHETSEEDLYQQSLVRIKEIIKLGTGAVEIKSGYGLTTEDELKMLRVIRRLKKECPLTIKATFLGAHAVPAEYKGKQTEYVNLIINEMIPMVAAEELADYIDVFCDKGFFTPLDTERILMAGMKYGLRAKIHANELDYSGGVQAGVKYNALSVDHLEYTGDAEIKALLKSETMPTLLPGAAFFLNLVDPPARKMIQAGLPLALASDYNPGSSPSGNMKFIMSLGCVRLRLLPEEVINAVTINSAYAMGLSGELGSIAIGKTANLFITKPVPTYAFLPYSYGSDLIETIILNGRIY
jgi:imidazolonepropionase